MILVNRKVPLTRLDGSLSEDSSVGSKEHFPGEERYRVNSTDKLAENWRMYSTCRPSRIRQAWTVTRSGVSSSSKPAAARVPVVPLVDERDRHRSNLMELPAAYRPRRQPAAGTADYASSSSAEKSAIPTAGKKPAGAAR